MNKPLIEISTRFGPEVQVTLPGTAADYATDDPDEAIEFSAICVLVADYCERINDDHFNVLAVVAENLDAAHLREADAGAA